MTKSQNSSLLDRERSRRSPVSYCTYYRNILVQNRTQALALINDTKLKFPSLYLLIQEIIDFNLFSGLNTRNITALKIYTDVFHNQNLSTKLYSYVITKGFFEQQVLRWMFHTGHKWQGPKEEFDDYDALMDATAAILIKKYQDKSILPSVVNLIFQRNRNNLFIHNLVWSFFQSYDPNSFKLITRYILSVNQKDRELAAKLLHLNTPHDPSQRQRAVDSYRSWISENKPYLYFTEEHFQSSSAPNPLAVDLEAKYFSKEVSPRHKKPLQPYTQDELQSLRTFHQLPNKEKEMLATYSHRLHQKNLHLWKQWMDHNIDEQIKLVKARLNHPNDND